MGRQREQPAGEELNPYPGGRTRAGAGNRPAGGTCRGHLAHRPAGVTEDQAMRAWTQLSMRLRSVFRRRRVEQELDDELRYHIERQIEVNVAAGMPPEDARYAALREF